MAIALTTLGCDGGDIKWTEEVKLHNGSIIHLKRRTEITGSGFPVQGRGFLKYHEFCYEPLGIHWKSRSIYAPEVFDIVDGKAYSKVSLGGCDTCMLHSYPETDALYFVWSGNAWAKIDAKDYPLQVLRLNLLLNPKGRNASEDAHGLVTIADKMNRQPSLEYTLEKTGARGLNETPARRGICTKCKSVTTKTDDTAVVFLSAGRRACEF